MKGDVVFELIRSMSQAEKRYFKRYATLHSEKRASKYVRLFELLGKQKKYDREALEHILKPTHFAQDKRHLYTKILESLTAFRRGGSINDQIGTMVSYHTILRQKGIQPFAAKELTRAKNLASASEKYHDLIKISQLETSMYRDETDLESFEDHLRERAGILSTAAKAMELDIQFELEYLNMVKWNKEIEVVRTVQESNALNKIIGKSIFDLEEADLSSKSRIYRRYILGLFYFFQNDLTKSGKEFEKQLEIFAESPHNIETNPMVYLRSLGNKCLINAKRARKDSFAEGMLAIQLFAPPTALGKTYKLYLMHMLQLMSYVEASNYSGAVAHIEAGENSNLEVTNVHSTWYIEWMYVCFNSASAYIGLGNYKEALRYINEFLNKADPRLKQDTYCIARVINLLLHFELDNRDLLEYQLESAQRFLKSRKRLFKFEKAVLQFIKDSLNLPPEVPNTHLFQWLKKELNNIQQTPLEKNVFAYFNFIPWLERKVD